MSKKPKSSESTPSRDNGSGAGAAFPVVGIGASAGGLEALRALLRALPHQTGMAFVIVQHLAPEHASSLAEILSRATKMPVAEVRDEPAVKPNHVYVIPPGRDMIISGGRLLLLPQERNALHRGIDQFFRSLAEDSRHQAIAVVLSGSATDGTLGLEVIKAEGGVTFAQDESAQHGSMPKSAVASGCVDFVLPPEGIALEIARIARHPYIAGGSEEDEESNGDMPGHGRIAEIVRRATGVDFTHYKANTMQRRIERRMMVHKIETLTEYEDHLQDTPGEVEALYQDVLINVTSFFRNPDAFEMLAKKIFPKMLADRTRHDPVRLWTLGCSTGEEAYSLAILFAECAEEAKSTAVLQMFASDLNASCIEKARAGRYPRAIAADVSPDRLRKYFVEEDGGYRVNKSIRERVVFSRHNVLADPPFSRVDFISCRNLLIYLEPVLQQQVLPLLHYALKPGGHLWLGSSESLGTSRALFDVEDARQKVFARKSGPTPPGTRYRPEQGSTIFPPSPPGPRETSATQLHRDAERLLLAKYVPPSVVVNASLDVVQFRGDTGAYLSPAPGIASHGLLKMLRDGLLVPVRTALASVELEGRAAREEDVRVKCLGGHRELAIEVIPLPANAGREAGYIIIFDESAGAAVTPPSKSRRPKAAPEDESEIARLTQELAVTREFLQSVIEEQDAVNEELQSVNEESQSANEEMQSVNEELETSKEEIQSSNEELATVNDELNHRNHELNDLTNDLTNVIASTQLAILIVTRDLRLRRFTPVAEKTLSLAAGDVGRALGDIKLSLTIPDLAPLLREVIESLMPREREAQDAQGRWFSLRARPYLTHDNRIDGAVVTMVDVDTLRRARDYAQSIVANVRGPIVLLDAALRVKSASPAFYAHFQVVAAQTEGRRIYDLGNSQWDIPVLRRLLEEVLPREHEVTDYEVRHTFENIGPRVIVLNARRLAQAPDSEPLIILSLEDITDRELSQQVIVEKSRLLDLTSDAIFVRDMEGRITYWNAGAEKLYGWTREEALGQISHILLKTETSVPFEQILEELHRDGHWTGEFEHTKRDGARINVLVRKILDRDIQGLPAAILETLSDITEHKRAQAALRRSEQRFRTAVNTVGSLIWTNNAAGEMEGEQPGWANFTGQEPEEYQGYGWAKAVHPDDAQPTIAAWDQAVAEKTVFVFEHRVRRADGEWRLCSIRAAPVLGEDGEIVEWVGVHTDITEQKRSEEILRLSEQRHRALITAHSDVVYRMNADWSEVSPMDGRDLVTSTAAPNRNWMEDNIYSDDRPQVRAAIAEAIRMKGLFELEHRVRRPDGSAGWTVSRAVPLLDARGEIIEWFGTASDVTERHLAEEALRSSEERYRSIINSSPDCIKVLDLEGKLIALEAGLELLGVTDVTPLLGKSWIELWLDANDHAAAEAAVAAAVGGGEGKFVGFFRTLHGLDKWWDVAVTPVCDASGQPVRLLAISRDVTEERAATEALRASEARKEAILASALDAIITMDHEGRLVEFNPGAERIFGHAREAVLGRLLAEVIIPERLRERHNKGLQHYLATGLGPVLNKQIELPALHADGREFPAELAIIAIPGIHPPVFTAFLRDVTERKEMEDSLHARAEELAQADRRKDEFLAMLAHELRNPLAPLRNAAEILQTTDFTAEENAQAHRIVRRSIENMSRMIDDLLDVSRITEGKIELRREPVSLEAILTAAASLVRSNCAAHRQELTVTLPPEPLYLNADATRLEQVLGNLLGNACKYSGENTHIRLTAERAHGGPPEVIIRVTDDGTGIAPELLPRVFDLFVQASRTLDRSHGGLGIGLTLVQRLVKLHDGSIEAHSEGLGKGAEFVIRLPILAAPPPPPAPTPRPAQETPRRILIVDDNTDSARSLAILQGKRGHITRTAFTGPDAVAAAAEFLPEVVLLDIGLPGMDGFEVARRIRAMPALGGAFLIAMSGYGHSHDRAEAKAAGFNEYMVKPVDLAQLREWLARR